MSNRRTHCKFCGEPGLSWSQTPAGWRLVYLSGESHSCRAYEIDQAYLREQGHQLDQALGESAYPDDEARIREQMAQIDQELPLLLRGSWTWPGNILVKHDHPDDRGWT